MNDPHTVMCTFFADFICHSDQHINVSVSTSSVVALATTVVNEGTV